MKKILFIIFLISIFVVSGCLKQNDTNGGGLMVSEDPQQRCTDICVKQIQNGADLSEGPCLSETVGVEWNISGWVCDVAHNPRKNIDDSTINQCQEYRTNAAEHFVEVTPNCEFIRKL